MQANQSSSFRFPTYEEVTETSDVKEVVVYSNHFTINFDRSIKFNEFSLKIISKEDLENFEKEPNSVNSSIPDDSRELVSEVIGANEQILRKKVGSHIFTGLTLFSIYEPKTEIPERLLFTKHNDHVLVMEKVELGFGFDELLANEKCRQRSLRVLNSNIKSILKSMNYIEWGKNKRFYNQNLKVHIPKHNVDVYKGAKTVIDVYEGGPQILIDLSKKIVRSDSLWREFQSKRIKDRRRIRSFFRGTAVLTNYGNQTIYFIYDVDYEKTPRSKFENGKYRDYIEYYDRVYNKKIRDQNQFLLLAKKRNYESEKQILNSTDSKIDKSELIYLVPELVRPTGLTDRMKNDFYTMKDIGRETIVYQPQRYKEINSFANDINSKQKNCLLDVKIDLSSNEIKGYQLEFPKLEARKGKTYYPEKSSLIRLKDIKKIKDLTKWVLFYDFHSKSNVDICIENMRKSCKTLGIKCKKPAKSFPIPRKFSGESLKQKVEQMNKENVDIVLFFMSKKNGSYNYKEIKEVFLKAGIQTQFFISFNHHKDVKNLSKYTNIVTQMSNKMGGLPFVINLNLPDTVIMGADVFHARGNQSVSALISFFGKRHHQHYSSTKIQKRGQEIMTNLSDMVLKHVKKVAKKLKAIPKKILFYRDGVGEGQVEEVLEVEVSKIEKLLKKNFGDESPKLMVILVTKRIDNRFAIKQSEKFSNPQPGLLVKDTVTKKNKSDFYLTAQYVNQGSARPTHYEIIYDNGTEFKLSQIYNATFRLTFYYFNWLGPVKVPAPVQYAHKLSNLIGVTQKDLVHDQLRKYKYYL